MASTMKNHNIQNQQTVGRFSRHEEKQIEDFFFSMFSILPIIGGIFGYHQSYKWSALTYTLKIGMYTSISLTGLNLLYCSYILRGNLSQFTMSAHCFFASCVIMTASISLSLHRDNIIEMFQQLDFRGPVVEYQESEFFQTLEAKSRQRILKMIIIFLSGYGACGLIAVVSPFVDLYLGNADQVTNVSGIYWKGLPFVLWWPYDAHNSAIAWILCFISQGIWALFSPLIVTSAISLCFYAAERILNHFKLLIFAIEHLDERTKAMYESEYKQKSRIQIENGYDECFYECIVQNVKHHHIILKNIKRFLLIANYAIAVPFFGGAILLGLAGMNLMSNDDKRIGPKLFSAGLGVTEATNMFMLCVYGEKFLHEGEALFNSIIHTRWYKRSMKCRKALMILQCGCVKPQKLTAARLIELDMATFSNLVNSAYSIFNLSSMASANENK